MPIYDFDGVVKAEVGKVYDNDGSANHQIGKVFDYNGTASSLIYSAETVLQNFLTKQVDHNAMIDAGLSNYDRDMATYSVTVGRRYYIRAVSSNYGSFTVGGTSTVRYNGTNLTTANAGANHTIWTANKDTLKITHYYYGSTNAGWSASCNSSLYMVVDVTDLDDSVAGNADTFWKSIGSNIFYGSKAFDF